MQRPSAASVASGVPLPMVWAMQLGNGSGNGKASDLPLDPNLVYIYIYMCTVWGTLVETHNMWHKLEFRD